MNILTFSSTSSDPFSGLLLMRQTVGPKELRYLWSFPVEAECKDLMGVLNAYVRL